MDQEIKDALSAVSKGATEGFLTWSKNELTSFIEGLKMKKFGFLKSPEMMRQVKEDYNSGEIKFYEKYVDSTEKKILLSTGITMRRLSIDRRGILIARIVNKYRSEGLHVAYISQNEMLIKYLGYLIPRVTSIDSLKSKISNILDDIDKHALFINQTHKLEDLITKVETLLNAHSPDIFIIDGVGEQHKKANKVFEAIKEKFREYSWSIETTQTREIYTFKRIN